MAYQEFKKFVLYMMICLKQEKICKFLEKEVFLPEQVWKAVGNYYYFLKNGHNSRFVMLREKR